MRTFTTSNTPSVSFLFLGIFLIAVGCAGISDNSTASAHLTPSIDQADLRVNTEVVTTVFNGNREQEQIIVIRPDL
jgi:hypothetical protein